MDKLKMHSPNLTQDNIARIREMFPGCVTESLGANGAIKLAVDFDQLRQELSESIVEGPQERYQLNWPGKREALLTANAPIAKTLRPCREESVNFDTTKNLFIEGDNLDALKLLQETYLGKVKLIYIDPPYNTGNDFIYEDDFTESADIYLRRSNQKDESGSRLVSNTESNGRFHSDWLSMMHARVRLAKNLLKDDGVFFVSIDNKEVSSLKALCDEVFGEKNFIECITWNKRVPKNDKGVGNIHEFILVYSKNSDRMGDLTMQKEGLEDIQDLVNKLKKNRVPLVEAEAEIRKLYKKQGYDRGVTLYNSLDENYRLWGKINMSWPNANSQGPRYVVPHPVTRNPVAIPARGWRWKESTFCEAANFSNGKYQNTTQLSDGSYVCGRIWFASDERTQPSSITYFDEVNEFLLRSILSFKSDGGVELEALFQKNYFSYPKPTSLIKTVIQSVCMNEDDIILDFFAGSSTAAHAAMQLSAEDGRNRRFVMVQLPEACDKESEAFENGMQNIAQISKARIRVSGEQIVGGKCSSAWNRDVGFRSFKIDTSNMADVYYTPDVQVQGNLLAQKDNIKPDRTEEDLLFQVMLDWGVDLALPIDNQQIQRKQVYFVDGNALVACFAAKGDIDDAFLKELANRTPLRVVFRDAGFKDDAAKINAEQIFKQLSPSTEVRCI